jgi:hypothetical protein
MSILLQPGFSFVVWRDAEKWSAQLQVANGWESKVGFEKRSDAWNWVFGLVGQHYPERVH